MSELSLFLEKICADDVQLNHLVLRQNDRESGCFDRVPDAKSNVFSVTKSITSAAVGFAVQEGLLRLEESVVDCFPTELPEDPSENLRKMTLWHLLTMTMGFEEQLLMFHRDELAKTEPDFVRYVLRQEVKYSPGERFLYNNCGPYLLGVLIQRRAGVDLVDYLMPRLFKPLGIERPEAERCPRGYVYGASGLTLTCREMSKLGQLYLDYGVHEGKQLLARKWIIDSATPIAKQEGPDTSLLQTPAPRPLLAEGDTEIGNLYGYLFWIVEDQKLFCARGLYGQFIIVCREKNAVIAIKSDERKDPRGIMRYVRKYLIPQLN